MSYHIISYHLVSFQKITTYRYLQIISREGSPWWSRVGLVTMRNSPMHYMNPSVSDGETQWQRIKGRKRMNKWKKVRDRKRRQTERKRDRGTEWGIEREWERWREREERKTVFQSIFPNQWKFVGRFSLTSSLFFPLMLNTWMKIIRMTRKSGRDVWRWR